MVLNVSKEGKLKEQQKHRKQIHSEKSFTAQNHQALPSTGLTFNPSCVPLIQTVVEVKKKIQLGVKYAKYNINNCYYLCKYTDSSCFLPVLVVHTAQTIMENLIS